MPKMSQNNHYEKVSKLFLKLLKFWLLCYMKTSKKHSLITNGSKLRYSTVSFKNIEFKHFALLWELENTIFVSQESYFVLF